MKHKAKKLARVKHTCYNCGFYRGDYIRDYCAEGLKYYDTCIHPQEPGPFETFACDWWKDARVKP